MPNDGGKRGYRFGRFEVDVIAFVLRKDGEPVSLQPKAFDTLLMLVENPNVVLSKDEMVERIWKGAAVNDDALAQCIRDIRQALEPHGTELIKTVPRRGYLFGSDVTPVGAETDITGRRSMRPFRVFLGLASAALVVCLGLWLLVPSRETAATEIRVAVMPLETLSQDPSKRWVADGLADDIRASLARFTDIGVISRNTSRRFGDSGATVEVLRDTHGAHFVLQGSLRLLSDELKIALQLVDTKSMISVWSGRFDEQTSGLLAVRDEVVDQIASQLADRTRDAQGARLAHSAQAVTAYEMALRARYEYYRFDKISALRGLDFAESAVEAGPEVPEAWEIQARLLLQFYVQPYDQRRGRAATLEAAQFAAQQALNLEPRSPRALATLGSVLVWMGRHDEALSSLSKAVDLNPADASIVATYADALSRAGQQKEALSAWERVRGLDPIVNPLSKALIARSHLFEGQLDEAFSLTSECIAQAPRMVPCNLYHAVVAGELGKSGEAHEAIERVKGLVPGFSSSAWAEIIRFRISDERDFLVNKLVSLGLAP